MSNAIRIVSRGKHGFSASRLMRKKNGLHCMRFSIAGLVEWVCSDTFHHDATSSPSRDREGDAIGALAREAGLVPNALPFWILNGETLGVF